MTADRKMRKRSPDYAQRALDVNLPHVLEVVFALVGDANLGIDAGGIDDGVDAAPSRDRRIDPRDRALGVLGVIAMRHKPLALLEAGWIAKSRRHTETRSQAPIDHRPSDPARGPRAQRRSISHTP